MSEVSAEINCLGNPKANEFIVAPMGAMVMEEKLQESLARKYRDNKIDDENLLQCLSEARNSFATKHKSTSLQTILAITNSMVGSVCLVLPVVFKESGIVTSLLTMIFLGFIQFKTCSLIVKHQKENETDFQEEIFRILGKNWANCYRLASGTYLFIVGIVYFLLVNKTCYPILIFFFQKFGFNDYALVIDGPTFNKFSIQYQAIILFIPLSLLLLFKDIARIIEIACFGIIALGSYSIFVVYVFAAGVSNDSFDWANVKLFTWDFAGPAGQFCLAFLVHNTMGQMINCNMNKENNIRDLGLSYVLSAIIYGAIGVFGGIGIVGYSATDASTILDYFGSDDIATLTVEALFLIHLFTAFPIFNFISRFTILNVFYPNSSAPDIVFYGFSAFYILVCLAFQLANINLKEVIGIISQKQQAIDGSVCGFFLVYIMPIAIHIKCLYGKSKVTADESEGLTIALNNKSCNPHPESMIHSKMSRYVFYSLITALGFLNLVLQILDLFKEH